MVMKPCASTDLASSEFVSGLRWRNAPRRRCTGAPLSLVYSLVVFAQMPSRNAILKVTGLPNNSNPYRERTIAPSHRDAETMCARNPSAASSETAHGHDVATFEVVHGSPC